MALNYIFPFISLYISCPLFSCIANLYPIDFNVLFYIVRDSILLLNTHCQKFSSVSHGFDFILSNIICHLCNRKFSVYITDRHLCSCSVSFKFTLASIFPHKVKSPVNSCTCPIFIIFICITRVLLNWNSF